MAGQNGNGRIQTILIVDNTPENLAMISSLLKDHYRTKVATSGEKALAIASLDPVRISSCWTSSCPTWMAMRCAAV